jgi:hypothetical protein
MRRIAAVALFVFLFSSVCVHLTFAQEGSATLTGFIQDSSKALIPGVKVTAINTATNVRFEAATGKDGSYTIVSLPVGPYQIQVEKPGFKTILKDDLFLHTQDALQINFEMAVGSTAETVTVSGNSGTNDSPAVSMTVDREFVENMPLNGRSLQDLIQLAPGTVSTGGTGEGNGYYTIDGQRTDANNYTVDGVSANLGGVNNSSGINPATGLAGESPSQTELGTTQSLVSVDSLQEFTIQTSGYTAEYGRSPGGQVQFTTRSGSNNLHGTVFDYLRNTIFDANSYSNDYRGIPKNAEHQNDFGGTLGGPVIVPRLYNGRDKSFYFLSYEGLRLLLPQGFSFYVPTQALRNSASPSVQPFLNAFPLPNPNSPGNNDGCTTTGVSGGPACDALFTFGNSYPNNLDNIAIRVDQTFGRHLHAFLRYADTPSYQTVYDATNQTSAINGHTWTAGLAWNIGANLVDDFRFNYSHDGEESYYTLASLGGAEPYNRSLVIPTAYDSTFAYAAITYAIPNASFDYPYYTGGTGSSQHQYQLINSLTWTRGEHSIKCGIDWRRLSPIYQQYPYQSFTYFYSLAAIQQGFASYLNTGATDPGKPVFYNLSVYAQDHWKLNSRFSLDYGLRWEFNPPPGPSNGLYPVTLTSANLATAMLTDDKGSKPYETDYHSFAPRFGFAWNAGGAQNHPLTVRGGFGIFFDTAQSTIGYAYAAAYPFSVQGPYQTNVPMPFSSSALAPPVLSQTLTTPYPSINMVTIPELTLPYAEQWTLSVDETLSEKNKVTASYVGNNGRKLIFAETFNSGIPGNSNFPNTITVTSNGSQSSYNALQVVDSGRITNGLDVIASFTWAHALDNLSAERNGFIPIYGNSDYDLRRVLNVALNYKVPMLNANRGLRAVANGWLLANRFATQGGFPINIYESYGATVPNGESFNYYPNLVKGVPIYLHGSAAHFGGTPPYNSNWRLNRAAFACTTTGATSGPCSGSPTMQGTLGRNYVRDPAFWDLNSSIQRSFPIREQFHLDFRVDAFNIFNHPNLTGPDTALSDSTFGELGAYPTTIGSSNPLYAMGAARSLQFSLKLQF